MAVAFHHSRVNGAPPHPTISLPNRLSQVFYLPPWIPDLVVQVVSCPPLFSPLPSSLRRTSRTGSWAAAVPVFSVGRK
ncbi:hypothetical protein E2C01_068265 [Portunus trituberculatus]|uniref:Uncharacterized protein n=1 Tax=Portunus trituberculatus TaxID=210409 RepID=A0A5B7HRG6_PORTR|nr:hypothetical protein [Portunus trituberculatus]